MIARAVAGPSPQSAYIVVNAMVLVWDLFLAGRIVNNRRGSPLFLALTALAALLTVPAVVVAATSSTILNGRAVHIIEWIWPLVLGVFAFQAILALAGRWVSPFLGVPLALFNILLFASGLTRFATTLMTVIPAPVAALSAAHASVLAFVFGRSALASPFIVQIPLLAPSYPAPVGLGKTMRAALATWAAVTVVLFAAEYPRSVHAAATFASLEQARLQDKPRGDLAIGVRILPALTGPPAPQALRQDLAVVDSLGAKAIAVVLRSGSGTSPLALDSLAHVLDAMRRDSSLITVISLGYGSRDGDLFRRGPDAYFRERLRELDRVVRTLRPDLVFPAYDPYLAGAAALGSVDERRWREHLREASLLIHRLRPATRVGVAAAGFTAADSALFSWAAAENSPLDVIAFSFYPSYGGGASLTARFHVADRWLRDANRPVWVFAAGAYPRLYGEHNQQVALWGELAWAASQPRVEGFIVDGAGDYDALTGLRAPGGRLRPALDMLVRARRTLAEWRAAM